MIPGALPWAPGAVRDYLIHVPVVTATVPAAAITTREAPDPIVGPFILIRGAGVAGRDGALRHPLVQVDAYAPKWEILGGDVEPEELAWNIAAGCGRLLGATRNVDFRSSAWSGEWVDGPLTFVDVSRGESSPLYRATVRVEVHMRPPRTFG